MAMQTPHPTVQGAAEAHGTVTSAGENPWINYFGPPNGPITTRAYDKYAEQTFDLPEAYVGKNLFLRDTIDGLITEGERPAFYTSVLLPWAQTDQINFSWNEFHFNETLAGRVPHEGVSRLVTSSRRTRQDKSVRRGLAMLLEHGFMSTPEGQEQYRRNLQGIAQCVQETANHDVMGSLLSCDNYDRRWERDHGVRTTGVRAMMQNEVQNFAIVQKTPHGLDILVEDVKKRLGRYGVAPDSMVVPPKFAIYLTLVRPERTTYSLAGPDGSQNIRQGPDAMTNFRGLNVFESRSFDVYANEPPVDLALRNRQVGEYYIAKFDGNEPDDPNNGAMLVYNEDSDNWQKISAATGFDNCEQLQRHRQDNFYTKAVRERYVRAMKADPLFKKLNVSITVSDTDETIKVEGANATKFLEAVPCPDPLFSNVQGTTISKVNNFNDVHPLHYTDTEAATETRRVNLAAEMAPPADIQSAFVELFGPTHVHETLRQVLSPGGQGRASPEAAKIGRISDSGYTGFTTLHCSYRGLGLIEKEGTVEEAEKAMLIKRFIQRTVAKNVRMHSNIDAAAARFVGPNYLSNSTGLQRIATPRHHVAYSAAFNELFEVGHRHTLAPVNADGSADALAHQLAGDAILCPDFCLAKFAESHNGIVGKLSLTNCGLGVVDAKAKKLPDTVSSDIFASGLRGSNVQATIRKLWKVAGSVTETDDGAARGGARRRFGIAAPANKSAPSPADSALTSMFGPGIDGTNDQLAATPTAAASPADFAVVSPLGANDFAPQAASFFTGSNAAEKIEAKSCKQRVKDGAPMPFALMYARPFIEHQMYTLIVMKGGPETGSCFYGHNSVTVGDDAVSKMHYCNATFYMKAVVRAEKNVYKAEDVYAAGYVGGNNCKFFSSKSQVDNFDASHPDSPSMFSLIISAREAREMTGPVNLTGQFAGNLADASGNPNRLHFGSAPAGSKIFGFDTVATHDPHMQSGIPGFVSVTRQTNTTCFQGAQVDYNPASKRFDRETSNTGHWGATYPGVRAVRDGAQRYVQPPMPTRSPYPDTAMVAAVK